MFVRKWLLVAAAVLAVVAGGLRVLSSAFAASGSQITVQVTPSTSFVPNNGSTQVQVTTRVFAGSSTQAFRQIRWAILPAQSASFNGSPNTDTGLFDYAYGTFVAGTTPGKPQIIVTDTQTGQVGVATINQYDATNRAQHLSLSLSAPQVIADGQSSVVATVTATDSAGVPVPVDSISLSAASADGGTGTASISPVTNNGDGTYTATITSGTVADAMTITATDSSSKPAAVSTTAALSEIPGPPSILALSVSPTSLTAGDTTHTAQASVTVTDAHGNIRPSDTVAVHTSGKAAIAPTSVAGGGHYTTTITASTTADVESITATDGSATSNAVSLTVNPAASRTLTLALGKSTLSTIPSSPPDSTTATATVTDAYGNPVPTETVTITNNGGKSRVSGVTNNHDGTYTATITATTPDQETITATDASLHDANGNVVGGSASAALVQLGPPAHVTLAVSPTHIHIGTNNSSMATATVTDSAGNPVPGVTTTYGSSSGMLNFSNNGTGTTDANGQSHVQVNGVDTAGPQTVYVSAANMAAEAVLDEYDTAVNMSVALSAPRITADGNTTSVATVTITDGTGNGVPGQTVTVKRSSSAAIDPGVDNGDGTYTFTIHSSKVAQTETITAHDSSASIGDQTTTLTEVPGPATTVSVSPGQGVVTADGHSTQVFTATVGDVNGNRVSGDHLTFTSSGGATFGSTTAGGNGTYTATATASTKAQTETVTATDSTPATAVSGTASLKEVPGPATSLELDRHVASLTADGQSTVSFTATVRDANANGVYGEQIVVTPTGGAAAMTSTVVDNGDGTYTVTLTASKTADVETITVADAANPAQVVDVATVTENPGPAAHVVVTPPSQQVSADQTTPVSFTATVTDVNGNAVKHDTIVFSGAGGLGPWSATQVNGDGTYTGSVAPATTAGTKTVTATDTSVTTSTVAGQASLTETPGAPTQLRLGATPSSPLVANGTSTMNLVVTVTDQHGNPVPGQTLTEISQVASGTPGITGKVADNGDGSYTVTLTSGTRADTETITVSDAAIIGAAGSTSTAVTEVAGPPAHVQVVLTSGSTTNSTVTANGHDQRTVTATVTDANGNPISNDNVTFTVSGGAQIADAGPTPTDANGMVSTLVTASTRSGQQTITATEANGSLQGQATLTQSPGAAATIIVSVPSHSLNSDGQSTLPVSALVEDANGNAIPNETVDFSSGNLVSMSPATATTDATGTASSTARARMTDGSETVTVTDAADPAVTASTGITLSDRDNVQTYVKAAYATILGRQVDAAGLAYWSNAIRNGMSRAQFASMFTSSTEYRTRLVTAMYPTYLHRSADSGGVNYWVGQIANGATFEQVRLAFIGSPEYYHLHGSNAKGAVDALYNDVLGRQVDPGGEQYWVQQLNSGQLTFSQLAASILYSEEGREHLVQGWYQSILGRTAPQSDLAYWAGQLANGTRDETIVDDFLGSTEYFTTH